MPAPAGFDRLLNLSLPIVRVRYRFVQLTGEPLVPCVLSVLGDAGAPGAKAIRAKTAPIAQKNAFKQTRQGMMKFRTIQCRYIRFWGICLSVEVYNLVERG